MTLLVVFSLQSLRNHLVAYFPRISFPWVLAALLTGTAAFIIQMNVTGRESTDGYGRSVFRSLAGAACLAYTVLLFGMVVFSRSPHPHSYNVRLFWSYSEITAGNRELFYVNLLNILLFAPLGLTACFASAKREGADRHRVIKVIIFGALISAAMELLQYVTGRGFAELDDIFHNTLGTAIGAGIAEVFLKCGKTAA